MMKTQRGSALVWALVALAVGFVAGWLLLVPPGTPVLAEGQRAVAAEALLVDELVRVDQLTEAQVAKVVKVLDEGGALPEPEDKELRKVENVCCWPDTCWPRPANELLEEIRGWVDGAPIPPDLQDELRANIDRSLSPDLRNAAQEHVCTLTNPDPCQELLDTIWTAADAAKDITDAGEAEAAWLAVKTDFDHFPSGRS